MYYKTKKMIIEEEISEVYLIDGIKYKADIATYGPYGVYGNMAYQNRQAVVRLENLGTVRIIFPKDTMLIPSEGRQTRFSPYAEKMIEKAVRMYVAFNDTIGDSGLMNQVMEFTIV